MVRNQRIYPKDRKCGSPLTKYSNLSARSRKKGKPHLTLAQFHAWYMSTPRKCAYCEIHESEWVKLFDGQHNKFGLEIDCIDPAKGYFPDNMTLACHRCNLMKSDILTYDEMFEIGQKYIKPKWMKHSTQ